MLGSIRAIFRSVTPNPSSARSFSFLFAARSLSFSHDNSFTDRVPGTTRRRELLYLVTNYRAEAMKYGLPLSNIRPPRPVVAQSQADPPDLNVGSPEKKKKHAQKSRKFQILDVLPSRLVPSLLAITLISRWLGGGVADNFAGHL